MQDTGKIILQLVYHREQVDIEHADIMIDEQTAVYREVVAAECRHDVPDARCDFAAAVNGRGRIERSESGDFVDESVVLEPLLVDDIAAPLVVQVNLPILTAHALKSLSILPSTGL